MSENNKPENGEELDFTQGPIPVEIMQEFQSRFSVDTDAKCEYHLFRVVAPKGPAQPVPAQIPVGATSNRKKAIEMAEQFGDNCTILMQRREWLVPKEKNGKTYWINGPANTKRGDLA